MVAVLNPDMEFKVRANGEWNKDFGMEEGVAKAGGPNIKVEEAGTYLITLDPNPDAPALTIEKMTVWGVVGSFEASGWQDGKDVPMTEKELGVWVSDPVAFAAGNEFKVRADGAWTVNFGVDDGVIAQGGSNVKVEADGTYVVTLDLNAKTLTIAAQ